MRKITNSPFFFSPSLPLSLIWSPDLLAADTQPHVFPVLKLNYPQSCTTASEIEALKSLAATTVFSCSKRHNKPPLTLITSTSGLELTECPAIEKGIPQAFGS
ncbi:hypothetical protein PanWU01x14_025270 [Parasponia andersonii]|uniref:Uncharacterized protein n=1 Tax=Parasponia andersonii TaxID=3476 RepID=A0A2P5DWX3_PARAD|nr:hypothetical protein PanWU01x14_025270 [Parasponia andersonii]